MNPQLPEPAYNRRNRRLATKHRGFEHTPAAPQSVGDCPFCDLPVYAAPGQAIKYQTAKDFTGAIHNYPTHKKCRKQA